MKRPCGVFALGREGVERTEIERRRVETSKSRTFSTSRDQCSITAGRDRDTQEEGWQSKNRKEGTPGADN